MVDRNKTLDELEGTVPDNSRPESSLVARCRALRRKPLRSLTPEDLRTLLGQQISLEILVPLALEVIETDPFTKGDMYYGDLLVNLLSVDLEFWQRNPRLYYETLEIVAGLVDALQTMKYAIKRFEGIQPRV